MFGFLKRLFGGAIWSAKKQDVSAITPIAFTPMAKPAVASVPAPAPPPFLAFSQEEAPYVPAPAPVEGSGFDMIPSLGNPDAYMIGLVGEQHYAAAVAQLREGMAVSLQLEPDNPYDSSAIAAVDRHDRVIGYIAQDSWLRNAVYAAGAGFSARVLAVEMGSRGYREVVLEVEQADSELRERAYQFTTPPRN